MDGIDLNLIADTFQASADETEASIVKCGHVMTPAAIVKKRAEVAAVRECCATLRLPGIDHQQALQAITSAARVVQGQQ